VQISTGELIFTLTPSDDLDGPPRAVAQTAEWVRRARAGDEEAFALLVEGHQRMVLRTGLRLLGRPDLAEDAAQEAFLRLHRHLGGFDETRELGPWLYRVVVNVCRDMGRRGRPARLIGLESLDRDRSRADGPAPDDQVAVAEQRRIVQEALLTLPMKEREAIVLRDIEGLSTSEVARILGIAEGTVRSQISTGRLKIKRFVEARTRATR
jgi:RNA polymerase sigma-70 factor (ECF subfamily)